MLPKMPLELKFTKKARGGRRKTPRALAPSFAALVYWQFPNDQSRGLDFLTQPHKSSGHAHRKGKERNPGFDLQLRSGIPS